ncbi:hemagglutinin repeat-containing protein [Helicobacter sp. 11S03491-1]|uniref:two-partner secretion domain-containing protein n=1 Tax=Helicobacter sp. 11S03491-1 TaxID=1476196 RepID=UPI000BA7B031|nr:hemagglutinin repeat-containing protein [Helicobacter sp. 11S03491-1]PAF41733.1 hypothetical protein BKH45_06500 [Helicobacter sp. 11S03491-1]
MEDEYMIKTSLYINQSSKLNINTNNNNVRSNKNNKSYSNKNNNKNSNKNNRNIKNINNYETIRNFSDQYYPLYPYRKLALACICVSLFSFLFATSGTSDKPNSPPSESFALTPDTANKAFAPEILKAHNDIPIVNITTPNTAGISNNAFKDFNVDKNGLIFNNIKDSPSLTQLSGYINSNPNLNHSSPAKLILNQITSSHTSTLLGYMEIAGSSANLIIANPNGIDCIGCGFINTANAGMITGKLSKEFNEQFLMMKSMQDAMKSLKFVIKDGNINIASLNGKNLQALNLISRTLRINGKIDATKIAMILGQNNITLDPTNASILLFEPIVMPADENTKTPKPSLALDVAYTGGVYANSIYLVASEEGVGVKNSGRLATFPSRDGHDGGFIIHSNGDIEITKPLRSPTPSQSIPDNSQQDPNQSPPSPSPNTLESINANPNAPIRLDSSTPMIYAGGDMQIVAPNMKNYSVVFGEKNVSITTANKLDNIGEMELEPKIISVESHHERHGGNDKHSDYDYTTTITQDELKPGGYHPAIIYAKGKLNIAATLINNTNAIIATPQGDFINESNLTNTITTPKRTEESVGRRVDWDRHGGDCGVTSYIPFVGKRNWNCHSSTIRRPYHPAPKVSTLTIEDLHIPTIPLEEMMSEYAGVLIEDYNTTTHPYVINTDPTYQTPDAFLHTSGFQSSVSDSTLLSAMMDRTDIDNHLNHLNALQASSSNPSAIGIGITAHRAILTSTPLGATGSLYNASAIHADSLYLAADNITNANGSIRSGKDMNIFAKDFRSHSSDLQAAGDIHINAQDVSIKTTATSNANTFYSYGLFGSFIRREIDSSSGNSTLNTSSVMKANNLYIDSKNTNIEGSKFLGNVYINSGLLNITTAMAISNYANKTATMHTSINKGTTFKNGSVILHSDTDMYLRSIDIGNDGFDTIIRADGKFTMEAATDTKYLVGKAIDKKYDVLDNKIKSNDIFVASGDDMKITSLRLDSDGNTNFSSGNNVSFVGVRANAVSDIGIHSTRNLNMDRMANIKTFHRINDAFAKILRPYGFSISDKVTRAKDDTQVNGNNIFITAGNTTMKGIQFNSNNDLNIKTKNLDINAVVTNIDRSNIKKTNLSTIHNASTIRTKNIHIDSENIKMTSIDLRANKDITIKTSGDIMMDTALDTTYTSESKKDVKGDIFSTTTTEITTTEETATNLSNTINGENINISAGGGAIAYNLVSNSKDFNISSKGDVILSNKADFHTKSINTYTKHTGLGGGVSNGKISINYGKDTRDEAHTDSISKHHSQAIVSDNITLTSNAKDVKVESSDLKATSVKLKGKDVLVSSLEDVHKETQDIKITSDRVGITLEVPTEVTDMFDNKKNLAKATGKTLLNDTSKIPGLKTISNVANSVIDGEDIETLESDVKSSIQEPKISLGYHHADLKASTSTIFKTASASSVSTQSLNITSSNNTSIIGSDVNAQNASIISDNFNVSLAKESINTISNSRSQSIDVAINAQIKGKDDTNVNTDIKYQKSKSNSSNSFITSRGSNLNIGALDLQTSGDTTIKGSYLNTTTANIQTQNFILTSSKNTSNISNSDTSYGIDTEFSYNGNYGSKIKGNYSRSSGDSNTTTHQDSIFNAKNLNLNAKGDANLIGSALNVENSASISALNLNILATQNIQNSSSNSEHIEGGIEGSYGFTKISAGGEISGGLTHSISEVTTYNKTTLSGGNFNITAAQDMILAGGNVSTNSLNANIGKNLSITSLVDTGSSVSASFQAGLKWRYNMGSNTGLHPSFDFKISNSSTQNLSHPSGIFSNGLNISVGDTIALKGSYINSNAPETSTLDTKKITKDSISTHSHAYNLTKNNIPTGSYEHTKITSGIMGVNITASSGDTTQSSQKISTWGVSMNSDSNFNSNINKVQNIIPLTQKFNDRFSQDKGIKKVGDVADYVGGIYKNVLPDEIRSKIDGEFDKKMTQATKWTEKKLDIK